MHTTIMLMMAAGQLTEITPPERDLRRECGRMETGRSNAGVQPETQETGGGSSTMPKGTKLELDEDKPRETRRGTKDCMHIRHTQT